MNIAQKARAATLVVLASILLAGCTSAPSTPADNGTPEAPPATEAQTMPEMRFVTVVDVLDTMNYVVTPNLDTDPLFGTEFTVRINDVAMPAEGECGYEETLAFVTEKALDKPWRLEYNTVTDNVYVDRDGVHHGFLGTKMVSLSSYPARAGFAYNVLPDDMNRVRSEQFEAETGGYGLWTSCPGFGE